MSVEQRRPAPRSRAAVLVALRVLVAVAGAVWTSCGLLNTPLFERIDDSRLRVIGVVDSPRSEAAPGDTITARAYFAGNPVIDVRSLSVSYDVRIVGQVDTFVNLRTITPVDSHSWLPDSMDFSFVVPESVFLQGDAVQGVARADAEWVRALMQRFCVEGPALLVGLSTADMEKLGGLVAMLNKRAYVFFTATSEDGSRLKVKSDVLVRYNSLCVGVPGLSEMFPVNNNPSVSWLGVYSVKGEGIQDFDPNDASQAGAWTLSYLWNAHDPSSVVDTIDIDTGYSYFIAADSGVVGYFDAQGNTVVDSSREWGTTNHGTPAREDLYYAWFYQNVSAEAEDPDSLLVLGTNRTSCESLLPPLKTAMDRFRVWVAVYDNMPGAWRPRGFAVRHAEGWFRFGDAYCDTYARK